MRVLPVPYHSQHDNRSGTGWRECFSSSVAMVAQFWGKVSGDDAYNVVRSTIGDTTLVSSHLQALARLGLSGRFTQRATVADVVRELEAGRPCCLGWLHQGPITRPRSGGHWLTVIGADRDTFRAHDPAGQPDLIAGGHVPGRPGRGLLLPWRHFRQRWEVEGQGSGWLLTVAPPVLPRPGA